MINLFTKDELVGELRRHGADVLDDSFHGLLGRFQGVLFERDGVGYWRVDEGSGGDLDALRRFVCEHWQRERGRL